MINLPKACKILIFSPHPDDDVFSFGATIRELVKNRNKVVSVYLTSSPKGVTRNLSIEKKIEVRKKEAKNACRMLGIKPMFLDLDRPTLERRETIKIIVNLLKREKPDIIFLPSKNDLHPTHRKVSRIVLKAEELFKTKEKWFYETWTPIQKPNFIFFFDENLMKIKIKAMKQHKSQIERIDYISAIIGLNTFRGIMGRELLGTFGKSYKNGKKFGEAFLVVKCN